MTSRGSGLGVGLLFLVSMSGVSCFRGLSVSEIKCNSPESCPNGYSCSMGDAGYGTCVPSNAGGAGGRKLDSNDAGVAGASGTHGSAGGTRDFDGGVNGDGRGAAGGSAGGGVAGSPGGNTGIGGVHASSGTQGGVNTGAGGASNVTISSSEIPGGGGSGPVDAPVMPDGPVDPGLKPLGASCSDRSECANGFCADKVCCNSACSGNCETCNSAGKCTIAAKGPAPASRTPCGGSDVCAAQCDGVSGSACVFPDKNVTCTAATCKDGTATTASVCNAGSCTEASTASCPSNQCTTDGSGKCAGSCSTGTCGAEKYCNTSVGVCMAKKSPGGSCAANEECATGLYCVDGVCCDSECKDQCMACNTQGSCVRISGAPRNGRKLCTATDSKCAGTCDLTSNSCVYPGAEVSCTPATCSPDQSSRIPASTCNSGACTSPASVSCGASSYCSDGTCTARADNGGSCTTGVQCKSNFCTSTGLCCPSGNITCSGSCIDSQNDRNNCGGCNVPCASNQTCSGGMCRCLGASLTCGSTTVCSSTGFESGLADGWSVDTTYGNGAGAMNVTTTGMTHGGSRSLQVKLYFDVNYTYADLAVSLCSSGTAAVSSFSIWLYLEPLSMGGVSGTSRLTFYNASGSVVSTTTPGTVISAGSWLNLAGSVSGGPVQASKVQIRLQPTTPGVDGSGLMWIDDVEWK